MVEIASIVERSAPIKHLVIIGVIRGNPLFQKFFYSSKITAGAASKVKTVRVPKGDGDKLLTLSSLH